MEVLGVSPIQRLVVPRVLAAMLIALLLNGMVSVVGVLGGYFFNVVLQGGTPGAYLSSFNALAQLPDLWIGEIKALIFGFIAGVVAAYRGLHPAPGPPQRARWQCRGATSAIRSAPTRRQSGRTRRLREPTAPGRH